MENKYYQPEIEEFYVSFECEMKNSSDPIHFDWEKCIFKNDFSNELNEDYCFEYLYNDLKDGNIRVKHLDREDIESLGWEYSVLAKRYFLKSVGLDDDEINSGKGIWLFHTGIIESEIPDRWVIVDCRYALHQIRFDGNLKNKSELRKLMQQLNINSGGK